MKYLKLSVMVVGVLLFAGCKESLLLPAPTPVSPDETSELEFVDDSLVFTWNSVEEVVNYAVEVSDNAVFSGALVYGNDELYDTTCRVGLDVFTSDSAYYWRVSAYRNNWSPWSETMEFTYEEQLAPLDLDTTYFPFGLGYEWCYQRHYCGYENYEPFSEYDTVTISVNDSFWDEDTMKFGVEGGFYDLSNPVRIIGDSIILYLSTPDGSFKQPISLVEQTEIDDLLAYHGDAMVIAWGGGGGSDLYFDWTETRRLKGIGVVDMCSRSTYVDPYAYDYSMSYRLLYFTTPEGQIYP